MVMYMIQYYPLNSSYRLPPCAHKSILYVCISVTVLQIILCTLVCYKYYLLSTKYKQQ